MKKRNHWKAVTAILCALTMLLAVAIPVTSYYETMINAALGADTQRISPDPDAKIFYWTEFETEEELAANDNAVCY